MIFTAELNSALSAALLMLRLCLCRSAAELYDVQTGSTMHHRDINRIDRT